MTTHTALYVVLKCNNVYRHTHTLAHTYTGKNHCCCCRFILQMTERAKLSTVDLSAISVTLSLSHSHQDMKFPVQMFSYVSLFLVGFAHSLIHSCYHLFRFFSFHFISLMTNAESHSSNIQLHSRPVSANGKFRTKTIPGYRQSVVVYMMLKCFFSLCFSSRFVICYRYFVIRCGSLC